MLEPLIVLTVLNCIFMFSSTVTSCALWWQYQGHRCCTPKNATQQKFDLKRSKSYISKTAKKHGKSKCENGYVDNAVSKSSTNGSREHKSKKSQKKRSKKSVKYLPENPKSEENISLDELEAKKLEEKTKMSEASQTINDTKSTVVMEFSTVQKVVQIVDDSDINSARSPLKDIVIQKDTVDKKHDHNVEQNLQN